MVRTAAPVISFPVDSDKQKKSGTGFFYDHGGEDYFVTVRHLIRRHPTKYLTEYARENDLEPTIAWEGNDSDRLSIIVDPQPRQNLNQGNKLKSYSIDLDTTAVHDHERWDVALIKLSDFRPRAYNFRVFDKIATPRAGQKTHLTGAYYGDGDGIDLNKVMTVDGWVYSTDKIEYDPALRQLKTPGFNTKEGFSGSPVHTSALFGILAGYIGSHDEYRRDVNFTPASVIFDLLN